jgi:hypothetical protein
MEAGAKVPKLTGSVAAFRVAFVSLSGSVAGATEARRGAARRLLLAAIEVPT